MPRRTWGYWVIAVILLATGCGSEAGSAAPSLASSPDAGDAGVAASDGSADTAVVDADCPRVTSAQSLPVQSAARQGSPTTEQRTVFVDDLFNLYRAECGGCHVDGQQGGIHTDRLHFAADVGLFWIGMMRSDDPDHVMPPRAVGGKPASQRPPEDPVNELIALMQTWYDQGKPRDYFTMPSDSLGDDSAYRLSESLADSITNIGSCLPDSALYATHLEAMRELDAKFAAMQAGPAGQGTLVERIGLPRTLQETDLFTFDSAVLAQHGVIAFQPAYPLWTDNAGKLRFVRVPTGESIVFHPDTQQFEIPPNTRFYKTFMQKVLDAEGKQRYRKMETRLIVSRPDQRTPDGTTQPRALFGTYAWNEDETTAVLVTDPLRNGEPFRDRVVVYATDQLKVQEILASQPANPVLALQTAGAIRRYAIPGGGPCVACHRGAPNQSFVLGFLPVQIRRRPSGMSGVIEPTGEDELAQLERFIDYGLVTGLANPQEVRGLEAPQGDRLPRNDHEITAQGYALGNCAHCHNPRGTPLVENPELRGVVDFMPGEQGGLFQFPLDRMSPRVTRGPRGDVPIPYVTPSLMDYPVSYEELDSSAFYLPKWVSVESTGEPHTPILAPWRGLLYRVVDTPFPYSDDFALFAHMPMFSVGFDCQAPRLFAEWMLSIPGERVNPKTDEYTVPSGPDDPWEVDRTPQPYREVKPGYSAYEEASYGAGQRPRVYESGTLHLSALSAGLLQSSELLSRYQYCPDSSDIQDPAVLRDPLGHPVPLDQGTLQNGVQWPKDGVPDHAHWVVMDLTEVPGPWYPRRYDAADVLVNQSFPPPSSTPGAAQRQAAEMRVVEMLQDVTLTDGLRAFATETVPFGLWVEKPECRLSSAPTVASFDDARPLWMDELGLTSAADSQRPLYMVSPGEAVFTAICANCHGTQADAGGRQAKMLAEMTGGSARVANLRDGLFGSSNRERVFGDVPWNGRPTAASDWSARYLAWMALGGTRQTIPASILAIVANTRVMGKMRPRGSGAIPADANMLATAKNLCLSLLPGPSVGAIKSNIMMQLFAGETAQTALALIPENGDAELWMRLCSLDNPHPVWALSWSGSGSSAGWFHQGYYPRALYPSSAPVMDARGQLRAGMTEDNGFPWCAIKPLNLASLAEATAALERAPGASGAELPFCPEALTSTAQLTDQDKEDWATRGAINAGLAAYVHVDRLASGMAQPSTPYDHCELLEP